MSSADRLDFTDGFHEALGGSPTYTEKVFYVFSGPGLGLRRWARSRIR